MKYIIPYIKTVAASVLAVAAVACLSSALSYGSVGKNGRTMKSLWREYEKYEAEDLPSKAEKVLREIVDKAAAEKSYADFTRSGIALGRTVRSYDWKAAGKLRTELREKAARLGNPVVTFRLAMSDVIDLYVDLQWVESEVLARKDALKAGFRPQLYGDFDQTGAEGVLQDFLLPAIENDYEFLLWSLYGAGRGWNWCCRLDEECLAKVLDELRAEVGGTYPAGAWLEYQEIVRGNDSREALGEFASKWDGKAVAVFARGRILEKRFSQMCEMLYGGDADDSLKPSSGDFVSFRAECEAFEKGRKAFSGAEADVAESYAGVGGIIREMDSGSLSLSAVDGRVRIVARNVGKAVLTLSSGDAVIHRGTVVNTSGSYFVPDTLGYSLPEIPDGNYLIECRAADGKAEGRVSYGKHTISAALRRIAVQEGTLLAESWESGVYVTDYRSGKPLEKADVEVSSGGKNVLVVKDFPLGGSFVPLTPVIAGVPDSLKDGRVVVKFSCLGEDGLRRESEELALWDASSVRTKELSVRTDAVVLSDRGAYNPGETVRFKAVLYEASPEGRISSLAPGEGVEVVLLGPKRTEIARESLLTNDFGSVFGSFDLEDGAGGGVYLLNVLRSGRIVASRSLRVDEFVLPTWKLEFDRDTVAYFDGDEVSVGGCLKSYSGHSLSGASVRYCVRRGGGMVASGDVRVQDAGRFSFRFKTLDTGEDVRSVYAVEVVVSDLTGETLQWSRTVEVNPSVRLSLALVNKADGIFRVNPGGGFRPDSEGASRMKPGRETSEGGMPQGDSASFRVEAYSSGGFCPVDAVEYELLRGREVILSGETFLDDASSLDVTPSGMFDVDLSGMPSGMYRLACKASYTRSDGKQKSVETHYDIFRAPSGDDVQDFGEGWFFRKDDGGGISVLAGCSDGGEWIVAELYDGECHLLDSRNIYLSGKRAGQGSLERICFDYRDEYPAKVLLSLLCFRDAGVRSCTMEFSRPVSVGREMGLSFERFSDSVLPGTSCTVSLLGDASAEYAVTVFDVSTETFAGNLWRKASAVERPFDRVWCRTFPGKAASGHYGFRRFSYSNAAAGPLMMAKSANAEVADGAVLEEDSLADDSFSGVPDAGQTQTDAFDDIRLREDFRKTLAFHPALLPDTSGKVSFEFDSADALGTYAVSVFAHDRAMRSAVLRREFVVTCPVKVSVVPPSFLYEGDVCSLSVAVANSGAEAVGGILSVSVFGGDDHRNVPPMLVRSVPLEVPADGQSSSVFEIAVPSSVASSGCLGIKAVFRGGPSSGTSAGQKDLSFEMSDGIFLTIPVLAARQTLTEAHSALLLPGSDRDSLKNVLMSSFTGTSPFGVEYSEKTLSSLLLRDIEQSAAPSSKDLVSLLSACYSRAALSYICSGRNSTDEAPSPERVTEDSGRDILSGDNLLKDIFACRNADGGFAWFKGFQSSPLLTALALERFAVLGDICAIRPEDLEASVRYLDNVVSCGNSLPQWRGGITMERYLYVRSMYGHFLPDGVTGDLKKQILKNLLPGKAASGRNYGTILENALRTSTLVRLSSPDCRELLAAWGIRSTRKISREAFRRIESLADHSVSRPDGSVYFPNAVMPWRGLLESEAYAHTLLCNLFSAFPEVFSSDLTPSGAERYERIADGLRLWLMLQKESQKWSGDPACIDAALAVLRGSDRVLSAKMAVMTKHYSKPMQDIREAGNGMKVQRAFYRQSPQGRTSVVSPAPLASGAPLASDASLASLASLSSGASPVSGTYGSETSGWVRLNEGDTLSVGERILSVISVWSGENRSFVMLDAPRHALLRPVEQLSGISGGWFSRPFLPPSDIQSAGTPFSFKEVRGDRTQWYVDVCPEEWSTFSEEYFVVCGGEFSCPAISVESLYTPNYRANSNFSEKMFAY